MGGKKNRRNRRRGHVRYAQQQQQTSVSFIQEPPAAAFPSSDDATGTLEPSDGFRVERLSSITCLALTQSSDLKATFVTFHSFDV
jgi:hypothetical protein